MANHASRPVLILVHGQPGTGKTTLARKLADDTGLPLACKDDIKEFFFDTIGSRDRNWSRAIGKAVSQMQYPLADSLLSEGYDLMLESAFFADFSGPELAGIVKAHQARCLEIYCETDPAERRRRFIERNESGERHTGHIDAHNYSDLDDESVPQTYRPLEIGQLCRVDTTVFGDAEYAALLREVQAFMKG